MMIVPFKIKLTIYGLVVVLAGAMLALGLKSMTYSEVFNPVEAETTYGPVKLTMRLGKTTYRLGEPVRVNLTIANTGNETVLLGLSYPCKTNFIIYDESSQEIFNYFSSVGWLEAFCNVSLNCRESLSQTLTWNQLEMDNFPPFASRQVQPGTYYIRGQVGPLHYVGPPEGYIQTNINIETPRIEIQIT